MTNYEKLKQKIQEAVPSLMEIEVGQVFYSKFYGEIVATRITRHNNNVMSIYGFDIKDGLPRSEYYPKELKIVGKEPMLNDVIAWLDKTVGCWSCIVGQHTYIRELMVYWDLLKPFLKDQDQELIDWLVAVGE